MKRFIDFIFALLSIILLSPIFIMVFFIVKVKLGSPVVFRQERPGLNGVVFKLLKFRTMTSDMNSDGDLLPDEVRLTKTGIFLRKLSLDELPQLINVLKGDMSIIGPRPLLVSYFPYYTEREMLRHTVRPGITGLAQISGRNGLRWDDRLELDVKYVETRTLLLDLIIFYKTLAKVLKKEGVVDAPGTVMLNFDVERKIRLEKGET
ncbi:sugar transferase [Paenibacillus helianthi]|uniref:sugar transferase n=1 Tax=Paenibacillus helianthi TaxID=1349432 RepID=UPI000B0E3D4E|nr:sugar transferase [Paenibacillus helianthi]